MEVLEQLITVDGEVVREATGEALTVMVPFTEAAVQAVPDVVTVKLKTPV